jgi:hypothetical protein
LNKIIAIAEIDLIIVHRSRTPDISSPFVWNMLGPHNLTLLSIFNVGITNHLVGGWTFVARVNNGRIRCFTVPLRVITWLMEYWIHVYLRIIFLVEYLIGDLRFIIDSFPFSL